jgi:hypothetical protein
VIVRRPAHLTRALPTQWGTFAAGLDVEILRGTDDGRLVICLDNRHHPAGRCHKIRVDRDAVQVDEGREELHALTVAERLEVLRQVTTR